MIMKISLMMTKKIF
ncbi:hypothetical protein KM1_133760 [Entamoeba histolytica HM-3:IMSS]|uniref:Uncharacterized protein n=1 Tax=Entamoeba histolytica HM-3:IMSS TaxID=885315 RepID=M7WSX7_ENTHI|nr:hypothetical protein KM1_133760 [Entamoeba histolytica HM-3:IMSS]